MRFIKAILPLLVTAALVWMLSGGVSAVPPVGYLLSPFHGFWQNAETAPPVPDAETLQLPGLREEVRVVYDQHLVPHIFARNNHDLYYAQGYVTARYRLWQMEIQTRLAAGRLSEVMGPGTLQTDRKFRRMGMEWAAQRSLEVMRQTPATAEALEAYAAGVNAHIDALDPRDYPLMYKLLGHAPRQWEPLHTALLLKLMSWDLTGESTDLALSRARARYGEAVTEALYPDYPPYQEPIVPGFVPAAQAAVAYPMPPGVPAVPNPLAPIAPPPHNGSNNWAVAASRSATGFPLLANDPHLTLRLPGIWYRIQLSGPDGTVTGVSLPGAPCVIIGFNGSIAWGVTNLGADVQDWYKITYTADKRHYVFGRGKRSLSVRQETIAVKDQPAVEETVHYTHHGPVVFEAGDSAATKAQLPAGYAMRWAGHEGGNELFTFYSLNRARSFGAYKAALTHYHCPGQNFLFADTSGTVALWCTARLPRKAKGQGKYLLDGSRPEDDWQDWIPLEDNPHVVRPATGWAASANQHPAGPEYPHYLGWHFATWERAARIHQVLNSFAGAKPQDLQRLQTDNHNLLAAKVLPHMLDRLKPALTRQQRQRPEVQQGLDALDGWHLRNDAGSVGAAFFEAWWHEFYRDLWAPHLQAHGDQLPDRAVTAQLMLQADTSRWYTVQGQPATLAQLLTHSYLKACDQLAERFPQAADRTWGRYKSSRIEHMAFIDAFGHLDLLTGGAPHSVNAMGGTHGPSWRMVVAVGPQVRGYGIFPGGQSENPGSAFYDDGIAGWLAGELREILRYASPDALPQPLGAERWQPR